MAVWASLWAALRIVGDQVGGQAGLHMQAYTCEEGWLPFS